MKTFRTMTPITGVNWPSPKATTIMVCWIESSVICSASLSVHTWNKILCNFHLVDRPKDRREEPWLPSSLLSERQTNMIVPNALAFLRMRCWGSVSPSAASRTKTSKGVSPYERPLATVKLNVPRDVHFILSLRDVHMQCLSNRAGG